MCKEGFGERVIALLEEVCGVYCAYCEKHLVTDLAPSRKLWAATAVLINSTS